MIHLVHGVQIEGQLPDEFLPFMENSFPSEPVPEFSLEVRYRLLEEIPELDEFWFQDQPESEEGSRFALFKQSDGFGLSIRCQGSGLFRFIGNRIEIEWLPGGTGASHYFYSHALPLWLEYNGVLVLHGSAVSIRDRVVAFIGTSGAGKSTLAAGLVHEGCDLVSDDGLPVYENEGGAWTCFRGPAQFRLWPSSLENVLQTSHEGLPRVHSGLAKRILRIHRVENSHRKNIFKLATVYLVQRRPEPGIGVTVEPIGGVESVMRLIENGIVSAPADALGLTEARLEQFSRLANAIPIKSLTYPEGRGNFSDIKSAIVSDLNGADVTSTAD